MSKNANFRKIFKNINKSLDKGKKVCYNVKVENIGVSPSGKASDSDSDITGVRIPAPQPRKKTKSLATWSFFNEAHLRCMKNEAGLHPMKRAFGSRRGYCALRIMAATPPLHRSRKASASYSRSECFIESPQFPAKALQPP